MVCRHRPLWPWRAVLTGVAPPRAQDQPPFCWLVKIKPEGTPEGTLAGLLAPLLPLPCHTQNQPITQPLVPLSPPCSSSFTAKDVSGLTLKKLLALADMGGVYVNVSAARK